MAKNKQKTGKSEQCAPNRHLHARVAFLHHAAAYLVGCSANEQRAGSVSAANASESVSSDDPAGQADKEHEIEGLCLRSSADAVSGQDIIFHEPAPSGLPLHFSSQLQQVARKSQIRLDASVKHASCKRCNAMLHESSGGCRKFVENKSRDALKSHADVLVLECATCGTQKRFPVGIKRQQKRAHRKLTPKSIDCAEPPTMGKSASMPYEDF